MSDCTSAGYMQNKHAIRPDWQHADTWSEPVGMVGEAEHFPYSESEISHVCAAFSIILTMFIKQGVESCNQGLKNYCTHV